MNVWRTMVLMIAIIGISALTTTENHAQESEAKSAFAFETPVRVKANGKAIEVGGYGYAVPCLADIDGDGISDLLVGQFTSGRIALYKGVKNSTGTRELQFNEREWLKADGKDVKIRGIS